MLYIASDSRHCTLYSTAMRDILEQTIAVKRDILFLQELNNILSAVSPLSSGGNSAFVEPFSAVD